MGNWSGQLLLSIGTLILISSCGGCGSHSWRESYRYQYKEPYDLYALHELLAARPAGLEVINDSLQTIADLEPDGNDNYIYVGRSMFLDEDDVTALLKFVGVGNNAFLFLEAIPEDLQYHLFSSDCFYSLGAQQLYNDPAAYRLRDSVDFNLSESSLLPDGLRTCHIYKYKASRRNWRSFNYQALCDEAYGTESLGYIDPGGTNFVRHAYGKGEIFVHIEPILFTNYYLVDSSRYRYAEGVLSYANPGTFYWDEYSRSYRPPPRQRDPYAPDGGRQLLGGNHTLSYILEQPALSFAWYLLLFGLLLFLLFRAKRTQRIIPIKHPKENASLQYVDTIARLSLQNANHAQLARRELKVLRHFLQERFQIRWREGQAPPPDLSERTGLDANVIDEALTQIRFVEQRTYLEPGDLGRFYQSIRPIYLA
ncbi:MAG: DUF4350 domain-containing protein [Bacteroidota bacterium]